MLRYYDTVSITIVGEVDDYTMNDVALLTCRRWKEPRFEVFKRETVVSCETLDVAERYTVDVCAQLITLVVIDERDALIAYTLAQLVDFDLL